jgi:hypothetical protein
VKTINGLSILAAIPLSGIGDSSLNLPSGSWRIHLLANSYVSLDTCVLCIEIDTPNLFINFIYSQATLLSLMTISSPKIM